ncbi:MAG: hypothetical protein B6226_01695 [Candidatus Cloacimonetes bacterium 4572_65]|nr:MAG: hypothetical protein B6226_01695 [Candidatus Cloacimonetes bacterium 4572_65]
MEKKLLTKSEAAKHLKLTESVVEAMIAQKLFVTKTVGRTLKIESISIESWLESLSEQDVRDLAKQKTICRFKEYFGTDFIFLDFEADNKYEAIRFMSEKAKELKLVRDARWLYEVVVAREELVSTAVGNGVALLHPRHLHPSKIKRPAVLFGRCPKGVDFDSHDDKPVTLFFMLLLHDDKQHLFSLSYLSRIMLEAEKRKLLNEATTIQTIHNTLTDA